jgi:CRISPR-associated endonuclease Csn1
MTTLRHLDYDTGEIVWSGEDFCEHMRKVFAYKSCFVSRMPEVSTGAFWDATVYSPRDKTYGKNLQMPLKSSARKENAEGLLEPRKYGGPRAVKKAFFFAFTARNARGRERIFFEGVPIYLAGKSAENLLSFAQDIATKKGYSDVRILRSFIPLRQKFEINGIPYYLGGSTSGYNIIQPARELYPDYGTQILVNRLFTSEGLDDEDCNHLYDWLVEACDILSPKLSDILLLRKRTPLFRKLALDDKNTQLVALVRKFCLSAQVVDIKRLGGSTSSGSLTIGTGSVFPSIVWIDPSVTGMFERRVSYSDLKSNPMLTLPSPE